MICRQAAVYTNRFISLPTNEPISLLFCAASAARLLRGALIFCRKIKVPLSNSTLQKIFFEGYYKVRTEQRRKDESAYLEDTFGC
jgi:hypothetical protein